MKMKGISEHTLLMNQIIGLCTNTYGWPSTLKDLGYFVDWVEPTFLNSEGKKVNPDLLLSSNKLLHSLVVECKGGTSLDDDQLDRLIKVTVDSIRNMVNIYTAKGLRHDLTFVTDSNSKDAIISKIYDKSPYPVLFFSKENLSKRGTFELKELEEVFKNPVELEGVPPTGFIPFNTNDDISVIAPYVFQYLLEMALKNPMEDSLEIDIDKLLNNIFPFWKNTEESKKKEFRGKINNILFEYKSENLMNYLDRIKGKPTWHITQSLQAFAKEANKIIDDLDKQKKLM